MNFSYNSGSQTRTGLALEHARQYGFEYARDSAARIALLVTDGKSDDKVTEAAMVCAGNAQGIILISCHSIRILKTPVLLFLLLQYRHKLTSINWKS